LFPGRGEKLIHSPQRSALALIGTSARDGSPMSQSETASIGLDRRWPFTYSPHLVWALKPLSRPNEIQTLSIDGWVCIGRCAKARLACGPANASGGMEAAERFESLH
jgi:hypothetical protein